MRYEIWGDTTKPGELATICTNDYFKRITGRTDEELHKVAELIAIAPDLREFCEQTLLLLSKNDTLTEEQVNQLKEKAKLILTTPPTYT